MEYEFRFVVAGVSVDDVEAVEKLDRELDAMLFRGGGVDLLDIAAHGSDALEAAMEAARAATQLIPGLNILRLHRDLVGIPEIAERVGVTRQNVHQWVSGQRRSELPFPPPEGTAGRSQIWLWSEVNEWLAQHGLSDGVNRPSRSEMADIDSALNCRLHHRTKLSLERWRRNRAVNMVAVYEAPVSWETDADEPIHSGEKATSGWSTLKTLDLRVVAQ
ncbi:MAG: hypothetical protein IRY84_15285 [Thermobispora bispora]|nr:hypothetical protein [Thermobispora bispora]